MWSGTFFRDLDISFCFLVWWRKGDDRIEAFGWGYKRKDCFSHIKKMDAYKFLWCYDFYFPRNYKPDMQRIFIPVIRNRDFVYFI